MRNIIKMSLNKLGYKIVSLELEKKLSPPELSGEVHDIINEIVSQNLTMTPVERLWNTASVCEYICKSDIPGDFVECGVWRGGHAILASKIFELRNMQRNVFLFDTFEGMTAPTADDVDINNKTAAISEYEENQKLDFNEWCYASIDEVKHNFEKFGCNMALAKFVKGDVLLTLKNPDLLPSDIAVLRLDTDWYDSTKLELETLFPKLVKSGFLIVDDYGHWSGSKKAVDEYFFEYELNLFPHIVDYSARSFQNTF